jgi:hypothetical protein
MLKDEESVCFLSKRNNNKNLKYSISYNSTNEKPTEINLYEPIYKLLFDYSDIENILEIKDNQITKYLYFNRSTVSKILYESNNNIHFKYDEENITLFFYFYLILLIKDNHDILNYTFELKYIERMNEIQNNNVYIYNKIIMAKMLMELAKEYKEINDFYGDENEQKLNNIIKNYESIIINNIEIFQYIDLTFNNKKFLTQNIDDIYIEIINKILIGFKNQKYNDITPLMEQLDMENINLNKNMFDEISKTLNSKEIYEQYIIKDEKDLSNIDKINFFYLLLKYIIKNPIYIYHIRLLMDTREKIKKIVKKKKLILKDNDLEIKRKYIVETLICTDKCFRVRNLGKHLIKCYPSNKKISLSKKQTGIIKEKIYPYNTNKNKQINHASAPEFNTQPSQDMSMLNSLSYLYKIISNKKSKDKMILINSNDYYIFFDRLIKELNIKDKKEEEILKNIIKEKIFKDEIIENGWNFNNLLKKAFSFKTSIEEIEDIKNNLPQKSNSNSIALFKNWLDKEK